MMGNGNNPWLKLKEALRARAYGLGFDTVGFAAPMPPPGSEHFRPWLDQGCHASMFWLEKNWERRLDPGQLLPGVGVVMTLGVNYRPPKNDEKERADLGQMQLSACFCIDDYHHVLKQRLKKLAQWLEGEMGQPLEGRLFVDTAPVLEKPLAVASGLGWQGKNTLLVSKKWGCWLFLGEYFLPLNLPPDAPSGHHCGTCQRCCDVCPTGALDGHGAMDARRCIAYLTIESKDPIPKKLRKSMGNRVVGCDACLNICPWNRFTPPTKEVNFFPRQSLVSRPLMDFVSLNEWAFRNLFRGTSIQRVGRTRFLRNLAVALGNWGEDAAIAGLLQLLGEPEALIRGAAVWSLRQIVHKQELRGTRAQAVLALEKTLIKEQDPIVLEEFWP